MEMEDEEVASLKQQLKDANKTIQDQNSALLEKTNEVERLQAHIKTIHLDEIIQLYQIQKQENEFLMERLKRVRSLLLDVIELFNVLFNRRKKVTQTFIDFKKNHPNYIHHSLL